MKKLFSIIAILFSAFSFAQIKPTDTLARAQAYNDTVLVPNANKNITATKLHDLFAKTFSAVKALKDSSFAARASKVGDTLVKHEDTLAAHRAAIGANTSAIATKRNAFDTVGNSGAAALWRLNKVKDSVQANVDANSSAIATKLNITDTTNRAIRPIAGTNISITGTYPNLTFSASGGGSIAVPNTAGKYLNGFGMWGSLTDSILGIKDTVYILLGGQSNALNAVATPAISTFDTTTDSRIQVNPNGAGWVTASPTLNNIAAGSSTVRNNTAFVWAKNEIRDKPNRVVRILYAAAAGIPISSWTPKTAGFGETDTSNLMLRTTIAALNLVPTGSYVSWVIFQQGEANAIANNTNAWLTCVNEFWDSITNHRAMSKKAGLLLNYPTNTYKTIRICIDSVAYGTVNIGTRKYFAVEYDYPGFDATHYTDANITEIGKYNWMATQKQGHVIYYSDSSRQFFSRVGVTNTIATPNSAIIGATSTADGLYGLAVESKNAQVLNLHNNGDTSTSYGRQPKIKIDLTTAGVVNEYYYSMNASGSSVIKLLITKSDLGVTVKDSSLSDIISMLATGVTVPKKLTVTSSSNFTSSLAVGTAIAADANLVVRTTGTTNFRLANSSGVFNFMMVSGGGKLSIGDGSANMLFLHPGNFVSIGDSARNNEGLYVGKSLAIKYTFTTNSAFSVNALHTFVDVSAGGGSGTVTLPTAVGCAGRLYFIRRTDAVTTNSLAINTTSSQTINTIYGTPLTYNLYNQGEEVGLVSDGANWLVNYAYKGGLTVSSAGTLSLTYGRDYIFNGTTSTWTLPAVSSTAIGKLNAITIKNRGTGIITLNTNASGNDLYTSSAVSTLAINPGEFKVILPDGTLLNVQ